MSELLTVERARELRICRVCAKPMPAVDVLQPKGWQFDFNRQVMPERITLAFGKEYAHTDCLSAIGANHES